jgi:hypothetical protein
MVCATGHLWNFFNRIPPVGIVNPSRTYVMIPQLSHPPISSAALSEVMKNQFHRLQQLSSQLYYFQAVLAIQSSSYCTLPKVSLVHHRVREEEKSSHKKIALLHVDGSNRHIFHVVRPANVQEHAYDLTR